MIRLGTQCAIHQLQQLHLVVTLDLEPVGHISFWGQSRQFKDHDGGSHASKGISHGLRVLAPGFVIVRKDDHIPATKRFAVLDTPLSSAHGVRRRDHLQGTEIVNVFFTFRDED